ncbi:MAG: CCA tRNA nucleotidyltransferase [Bacillota bacterium]
MRLSLPVSIIAALPIVRRLQEHQYEAVFVGGSVRDTVLGLPVKDVDIATSARPEQVLKLFERCIPTGLQHGTITVIQDSVSYEVTTFRQESVYEAHRKPESVLYITDLEGDLLRRDFTMNAMALTDKGELLDPFGGLRDLKRGTIRCVGDADSRFQEDALRMLRAIRFIGVYQLSPAHQTWKALIRHRALMKYIAMERVQAELDKMLAGDAPQRGLHFVAASGLLLYLKEPFLEETEQLLKGNYRSKNPELLFSSINQLKSVDLRWAAIAIGTNMSLEAAQQMLRVLRFSNHRVKSITAIVAIHKEILMHIKETDERKLHFCWIRSIIRYGERSAIEWLEVAQTINEPQQSVPSDLLSRLTGWLNEMPISSLKQLNVSGSDLKTHLRRPAGPWISEWLNKLLFMAASGELPNKRLPLIEQAIKWDEEDINHE